MKVVVCSGGLFRCRGEEEEKIEEWRVDGQAIY
jgi:hypothetical protein